MTKWLLLLAAGFAANASALTVGDPAPPLKAIKWVKGDPVAEFKPGMVYVVQFWATWCGPCVAETPHLTKLAHQYRGKTTFIGVHSEANVGFKPADEMYLHYVRTFVEKRGKRMDYAVAVDSPETHATYKDWVGASGGRGPSAFFIIDRAGKIAWINGPSTIDEALAKVLDGSIDLAAAKVYHRESVERNAQREPLEVAIEPTQQALARGDYVAAVGEADMGIANHIDNDSAYVVLSSFKLKALLHVDERKALDYGRSLLSDERFVKAMDSANFAFDGAWTRVGGTIGYQTGLSPKAYAFAIECLKTDVAQRPDHIKGWASLATAYERSGAFDKAIEAKKQAIAICEKVKGKPPYEYLKDEDINVMKDDLKRLQGERSAAAR